MKLIALCGAPGAGKTEVQTYIEKKYGAHPVDDGGPLRSIAMDNFGLTHWHVSTQTGKKSIVPIPGGRKIEVRKLLGELGNAIELIGGADAIPAMALERAKRDAENGWEWRSPTYCFGSVRRDQGVFYKKHGAKIIEIIRPGYEVVNEFDRYNTEIVDLGILNSGTTAQLREQIDAKLGPWLSGAVPELLP